MTLLTTRSLNRALLARQMLVRRAQLPALDLIEHLVGLQAQVPNPPYIGLWTRLDAFDHAELSRLIQERRAVRIALMRSTIHLVSARDALALRPLLQPVIDRGHKTVYGKRLEGLEMGELAAAGRALVEGRPQTFSELGERLRERWPDRDPEALGNTIRALVPLVQVPPRGLWGASGPSAHTSIEAWLGRPLEPGLALEELIRRYLAAFGPATVKDMQAWSGLTRLGEAVKRLRPDLRTFLDEQGNELFDLPGAPLPDPETPVVPRFLPEYDNALLAHADHSRIIAERYRPLVWTKNGIIRATLLVDGFVRGLWRVERQGETATLVIALFEPLEQEEQVAVREEGARLLAFVAGDSAAHEIRMDEAGTN